MVPQISIKIIVVLLKLHIPVNSRNSHYPNMLFLILPTSLTTFWGILCNEWNISPLKIILIIRYKYDIQKSMNPVSRCGLYVILSCFIATLNEGSKDIQELWGSILLQEILSETVAFQAAFHILGSARIIFYKGSKVRNFGAWKLKSFKFVTLKLHLCARNDTDWVTWNT